MLENLTQTEKQTGWLFNIKLVCACFVFNWFS